MITCIYEYFGLESDVNDKQKKIQQKLKKRNHLQRFYTAFWYRSYNSVSVNEG